MKFPWRLDNETEAQKDERIGKMIDDLAKNTKGVPRWNHGKRCSGNEQTWSSFSTKKVLQLLPVHFHYGSGHRQNHQLER